MWTEKVRRLNNAMAVALADAFLAFPNVLYLWNLMWKRARHGDSFKESYLVRKSVDMVPYQDYEARKSNVLYE